MSPLFAFGDISLFGAAAVGAKPKEAAASGSGILRGAVDAVADAVAVAEDVCARASNVVGLAYEHLMPEGTKVPDCLGARVVAFGPDGKDVVELVAESVVSGSSTALVILIGHGVSLDDSLVETIPRYSGEQDDRAYRLARRLQQVVDAQGPPAVGEGEAQ